MNQRPSTGSSDRNRYAMEILAKFKVIGPGKVLVLKDL
jgi:hypothetical protein